jgi:hypothetical protein
MSRQSLLLSSIAIPSGFFRSTRAILSKLSLTACEKLLSNLPGPKTKKKLDSEGLTIHSVGAHKETILKIFGVI